MCCVMRFVIMVFFSMMMLIPRSMFKPSSFRALTTIRIPDLVAGGTKRLLVVAALKKNTRHTPREFSSSTTTIRSYQQHQQHQQQQQPSECDAICELASSNLRFGPGATREVGQDVAQYLHAKHVVVFYDANVVDTSLVTVLESLQQNSVHYTLYPPPRPCSSSLKTNSRDSSSDGNGRDDDENKPFSIRFEPNDASFRQAADFLTTQQVVGGYDAVIALGGGSVMDTAKAANLYACHPPEHGDFYDYVNPPLGKGLPPPGPVKPLIAIPTTAGTGSETTGVAIFDDGPSRCKTGIAHRHLKPTLGIVDPDNTITLPPAVAAYSGLDVLCHAIESYTALPFTRRPKPSSPLLRPAYQGSNPISDVWSLFALETCATFIHDAVRGAGSSREDDGDDDSLSLARQQMLLASSAAGLGFGNAGVHLCHGMSYPVSSQNKSYTPPYAGYNDNNIANVDGDGHHALIPHGLSVIVHAPTVFTWTGPACPERHATCARILMKARCARQNMLPQQDASTTAAAYYANSNDYNKWKKDDDRPGAWLADEIRWLCSQLVLTDTATGIKSGIPTGLKTLNCYTIEDIPALVQGTIQQHRVTKISPRQPVDQNALEHLFTQALQE
jgi:hydroxyacid-oxoacid transhydrogenase